MSTRIKEVLTETNSFLKMTSRRQRAHVPNNICGVNDLNWRFIAGVRYRAVYSVHVQVLYSIVEHAHCIVDVLY